jgi:hypothetical protein
VNLSSGVGFFDIDGGIDQTVRITIPTRVGPRIIDTLSTRSTALRHNNVYAYSYINLLKDVTFTLGVSGDFTDGSSPDVGGIDHINPKVGMTWNPFPDTTLRVAAFRVLKRTLITNQTLEPTQVAGFNQFFDDNNGTDAWRYGAAIDQKFTKDLFGGLEFSKRDLKAPFLFSIAGKDFTRREDRDEDLDRAYLFWTPHAWLALRAEYIFEYLKTEGFTGRPKQLNTHRVPLGISLFHPSGLSASLRATYFNQDGKSFIRPNGKVQSGSDAFWIGDVAINYRLPQRYGFITVGATNLFDRKFKFFDTDINNPSIQPSRVIFGRVTLALP